MNAQQIINRWLRISHTNAVDYPDVVEELNLTYQDLVDRITQVTKWDYFWDIGKTATVVNQSEYVVEKLGITPDDLDIKKINKVFVRYNQTDQYPTLLKYQNPWALDKHPDYYKAEATNPFFYIQDTSIFIYPAPQEAIADAIEIYVIHKPADLTENTTEANIEIPAQYHDIIAYGLAKAILETQGKWNEASVVENEYEKRIREMVAFMKQRYNQPIEKKIIWLEQYY